MVTEKQKKHVDTVPQLRRGIIERAYGGKSKATAIKAKCIDCMGYEDVKTRVSECASEICPLWPYRPYQKSKAKNGRP